MVREFGSRLLQLVAVAAVACSLTMSAGAQVAQQPDVPKSIVVFFDNGSAALTPEARSVVLSAINAAKRAQIGSIELAAYSSSAETGRDELAAKRAEAVSALIEQSGYRGSVYVDHEAPGIALAEAGDDTFTRSAVLRLGG